MTAVLDHSAAFVGTPAPAPRAVPVTVTSPYGFEAPTLESARATLVEVFGPGRSTDTLWGELLSAAAIKGASADIEAMDRLATTMQASRDAVVSLCGSSLSIRVRTYVELSHVREICDLEHARS